ncbi:MAG TPA: hypothetical protein PKE30_10685 [Niabella sp.]|nr:hypothetical protein [Niabella sp.]
MREFNIPGLSAAIADDGKLIGNKALGMKSNDPKELADTDTV